jgi:hypothetical protein
LKALQARVELQIEIEDFIKMPLDGLKKGALIDKKTPEYFIFT